MFGRFGLYLIPLLLPLAAHASQPDTIAFNAAPFAEIEPGQNPGHDIAPAILKAAFGILGLARKTHGNARRHLIRINPRRHPLRTGGWTASRPAQGYARY